MNSKNTAYWAITGLFALAMVGGGVADLTQAPPIAETMAHLGYPTYVAPLLGVLKLSGAVALLVPRLGRLKEWAYAGFAFDFLGATVSHLAVGDGVATIVPLIVLSGLLTGSYLLRSDGALPVARPLAA